MDVLSILGKSGTVHDAKPFKLGEEKGHNVDASYYFAQQLE